MFLFLWITAEQKSADKDRKKLYTCGQQNGNHAVFIKFPGDRGASQKGLDDVAGENDVNQQVRQGFSAIGIDNIQLFYDNSRQD